MHFVLTNLFLFAPLFAAAPSVENKSWDILKHGIAETGASRRSQAIAAASTVNSEFTARLVESGLADKDTVVRLTAITALGSMKLRSSMPKLKQALNDTAPEVSFAAAKALWEMGDRSGREILMAVAAGERKNSQSYIKGSIRDAKSTLRNPGQLALMGAKEGAGFVFGPLGFGISVVEGMTKDASAPARALSVALLGEDNDPRSLEQLKDSLTDKNWIVRTAAAKALGNHPRLESIGALDQLLSDKHDAVRYMAAASIIRIGMSKPAPRRPYR